MLYLVAQMLLCLIVAVLLGAVGGWLVKDLVARRDQRQLEERAQRQLRRANARTGTFKNQLTEARQKLSSLGEELRFVRSSQAAQSSDPDTETVDSLRAELVKRDQKIQLLRLQVSRSQAAVDSEWQSIKALKTDLAERQERLESRGKRLGLQWTEQLKKKEQALAKLRGQLYALERQNALLGEQHATAKQALAAERKQTAQRISELEAKLTTRQTRPIKLVTGDETAGSSTSEGSAQVEDVDQVEKDNLEQIRGIGPVLHRRLNELGIYSFRQIAQWTEDDLASTSSQLGALRSRIQRDGWVESAKRLLREKSGRQA